MNKDFINGSTVLGTAVSLFGVGTIVPEVWQKTIMFASCFYFLTIAAIIFIKRN